MTAGRSLNLVLCAIPYNTEILLLNRRKAPYRGYWGLPGGKIRFGETVPQAACREAREETGLATDFLRVAGVTTETIQDQAGTPEAHFFMFVVVLHPHGRAFAAGDEGALRWTALADLDAPDIIPSDRAMIERFVRPGSAVPVRHFRVERSDDAFRLLP